MTTDDATLDNGETDAAQTDNKPRKPGTFTSETARAARSARSSSPDTEKDKARKALEKKAATGDVYAIRELREHEAYWYPNAAAHGDWMAALAPTPRSYMRATIALALAGETTLPPCSHCGQQPM